MTDDFIDTDDEVEQSDIEQSGETDVEEIPRPPLLKPEVEAAAAAIDDQLAKFDDNDFDDDFDDDFEEEIEGEYELDDDEFADEFDRVHGSKYKDPEELEKDEEE